LPEAVEETPVQETGGTTDSSAPETDVTPPPAAEPPDPNRFDALPVVDPGSGFGGVSLGMTIAELQQISGVTVTEFTEAQGRTDYCYGRYTSGSVSGYISVRGAWGELPQDPDELYSEYRVTTIVPEVPLRTPEGIAVGSTFDEVSAAYPDLDSSGDVWWAAPRTYHEWARFWRFESPGDSVTRWWLDGLQNCESF
jgi:hypothetical protein